MEEGLKLGLEPGVVCGQVVPPALNLACRSQSGLSPPAVSSEYFWDWQLPLTLRPQPSGWLGTWRLEGGNEGGREEGKEAQAVEGGWEERLLGARGPEAAGLLTVKETGRTAP